MRKNFQKNDPEWDMFRDFYGLVQEYAEPEDNDAWFNKFTQEMVAFGEKYGRFGQKLAIAYIELINEKTKAEKAA